MAPKTNFKRGFKKDCDEKALFYRKELNLSFNQYLPAKELAEHLGILILTPEVIHGLPKDQRTLLQIDASSLWSGATFHCNGTNVIIYNDCHADVRQESTIMHEIAHVICGHYEDISTVSIDSGLLLREHNQQHEDEASWLGACLQLPREGLLWALKQGMSEEEIAKHFNASSQMTKYRLGKSGAKIQFQRAQRYRRR